VNNFAPTDNPRQNAYPQGPPQSHGTSYNGQQQFANNIPSTPEAPRQSFDIPQQVTQQLFGINSNEAPRQGALAAQNQGYPNRGPTQASSPVQNFGTSNGNSQQNFATPNNFPQSAPAQGYGTPNQAGQRPVGSANSQQPHNGSPSLSPTFGLPSSQQTPNNVGASYGPPPIAGGPIYVGSLPYVNRQAAPEDGNQSIRPILGSVAPTLPTPNAVYPPASTPSGPRFPGSESNNQNNFNAADNFVDQTNAARAPSSNYGTPSHRGPSSTQNAAGGQGY
jgi:hypothetical protein